MQIHAGLAYRGARRKSPKSIIALRVDVLLRVMATEGQQTNHSTPRPDDGNVHAPHGYHGAPNRRTQRRRQRSASSSAQCKAASTTLSRNSCIAESQYASKLHSARTRGSDDNVKSTRTPHFTLLRSLRDAWIPLGLYCHGPCKALRKHANVVTEGHHCERDMSRLASARLA